MRWLVFFALLLAVPACRSRILGESEPKEVAFDAKARVSIIDGLAKWEDAVAERARQAGSDHVDIKSKTYHECAITKEMEDVVLCLTYNSQHMKVLAVRMRKFLTTGKLIPAITPDRYDSIPSFGDGFSTPGGIWIKYLVAAAKYCVSGRPNAELYCPSDDEVDYFSKVLAPMAEKFGDRFTVVNFSSASHSTAVHEILHAQFNSDRKFRAAVIDFWSAQVTPKDREQFRATLIDHGYPKDIDESTVITEFASYMMEPYPNGYIVRDLFKKYRSLLFETLRAEKVVLVMPSQDVPK